MPMCELDHYKLLEGLGGLGYKSLSFILKDCWGSVDCYQR